MSRKPDRGVKPAQKVLDPEARKRQLRHHLDSLERDNFVALNEYEAIIATAAAAATAQGLLPPLSPAVGSIVGGVVGTVGPGAVNNLGAKPAGALSGSRSKKTQLGINQSGNSAISSNSGSPSGAGSNSNYALLGHRKPVLPRKPLNQLLEESRSLNNQSTVQTYVTAAMGP
ncbi:hypothetical protein BGZ80_005770, partial [Entomortierella chlamydospora]